MSDALVRDLSDGEQLVIEGETFKLLSLSDDPRDRAMETRRLAFDQNVIRERRQW